MVSMSSITMQSLIIQGALVVGAKNVVFVTVFVFFCFYRQNCVKHKLPLKINFFPHVAISRQQQLSSFVQVV